MVSLVLVGVNAWMGARVVYSGLKPGVLTTHLALAMMLTGTLAYCAWRGTDRPWRVDIDGTARRRLRVAVGLLLLTVVALLVAIKFYDDISIALMFMSAAKVLGYSLHMALSYYFARSKS